MPSIRVTAAQASAMRASLLEWRSPAELRCLLDKMAEPHGFYAASQGVMQFWREAFLGCEIATLCGAKSIRLCNPDPPDFELLIHGRIEPFELVEIRDPLSRVGQEFDEAARRENAGEKPRLTHFDPDDYRLWLGQRLSAALARKAAKDRYASMTLVAYVHAWIFPSMRSQADNEIERAVTPHLGSFKAIWVVASGKLSKLETGDAESDCRPADRFSGGL